MISLSIQIISIIVVIGFSGMFVFQMMLAFGAPLAHLSWGGKYSGKLPKLLRLASFFSSFSFLFGGICVLEVIKVWDLIGDYRLCRHSLLFFGVIFSLGTLGNLNSKSKAEKKIMTPVSLTLAILSYIIFFAVG